MGDLFGLPISPAPVCDPLVLQPELSGPELDQPVGGLGNSDSGDASNAEIPVLPDNSGCRTRSCGQDVGKLGGPGYFRSIISDTT